MADWFQDFIPMDVLPSPVTLVELLQTHPCLSCPAFDHQSGRFSFSISIFKFPSPSLSVPFLTQTRCKDFFFDTHKDLAVSSDICVTGPFITKTWVFPSFHYSSLPEESLFCCCLYEAGSHDIDLASLELNM